MKHVEFPRYGNGHFNFYAKFMLDILSRFGQTRESFLTKIQDSGRRHGEFNRK